MSINWGQALLSGIASGANTLSSDLQKQQLTQQKQQLLQAQAKIELQKEFTIASLKAPAEKTVERDDPTNPGHQLVDTQQWNAPTIDGQAGFYKTIGTHSVPTTWKAATIPTGNGMQQQFYVDQNNPANRTAVGSPRPIWDPAANFHDPIKVAGSDAAGNPITNLIDPRNPSRILSTLPGAPLPYHDPIKVNTADASGNPVTNLVNARDPTQVMNTFAGAPQMPYEHMADPNDPSSSSGPQVAFDRRTGATSQLTPPLSQLNAPAGATQTVQSAPMRAGGAGASTGMNPQAAKGTQGPGGNAPKTIIATGTDRNTGQKFVKYSDGTIAPAP